MKLLVLSVLAAACVVSGEFVDRPCSLRDPYITECFVERMEGGREIIGNRVDPLIVKETKIDQTLSDLVWLKGLVKNAKTEGFKNAIIEEFRANPKTMTAELRLTIPLMSLDMEYDVHGQLLIIPVQNRGFFQGNFTDIKMFFRGHFSKVNKGDEEHLHLDKLEFVSRVGDGVVKMTSKNPELQFAADLISNFYNENPRRLMDAINPMYVRTTAVFYKAWANDLLSKIPANHIIVD